MAVVDPKKKPSSIEKWWPIDGEKQTKFKMPSKERLIQVDGWIRQRALTNKSKLHDTAVISSGHS